VSQCASCASAGRVAQDACQSSKATVIGGRGKTAGFHGRASPGRQRPERSTRHAASVLLTDVLSGWVEDLGAATKRLVADEAGLRWRVELEHSARLRHSRLSTAEALASRSSLEAALEEFGQINDAIGRWRRDVNVNTKVEQLEISPRAVRKIYDQSTCNVLAIQPGRHF
jgi:hypothetical protein